MRASLTAVAVLALACAPHQSSAASGTAAILKARLAAPDFDYFGERERLGLPAFEQERDQIGSAIALLHDGKSVDDVCVTPQEHRVLDGYYSASRATSANAWAKDRKAAEDQFRSAVAHIDRVVSGEETRNPREQAAATMARAALQEASPQLKTLYLRGARDQLARAMLFEHIDMGQNDPSLSENATLSFLTHLTNFGCNLDRDNRVWLDAEIKSHGWFDIKRFGARADGVAWLLVQHADEDAAFQADTLQILEHLARSGETNMRNYAYLYDRVAINQARPQRYGTQGRCISAGVWQMDPVESPATLGALRQSAGLGPEDAYAKDASEECA